MSQPPDNAEPRTDRLLPWGGRAALLVGGTLIGVAFTAGPMILSEWDSSPGPARMRLLIALVCGVLMLPFVIPAFWWKSPASALTGMFGPALVAAITSAQRMDEDYSFLLIGVPVMLASGLLMAVILPARRYAAGRGRCHACGYDLRAATERRCPECGTLIDSSKQERLPRQLRCRWAILTIIGLAAATVALWGFIRFLLSLG